MCGIFGITQNNTSHFTKSEIISMISSLLLLSESRGKEASGLAIRSIDSINVYKKQESASKLIKTNNYKKILSNAMKRPSAIIGHTRLVTNGSMDDNQNNQPVIKNGTVGIHNGIITNDNELWHKFLNLKKTSQVDTEVLFGLIKHFFLINNDIASATSKAFSIIEGSASISLLFDTLNYQILATNTGSLYYIANRQKLVYASEKMILVKFLKKHPRFIIKPKIQQIKPNNGLIIDIENFHIKSFSLIDPKKTNITENKPIPIIDISTYKKTVNQKQDNSKTSKELSTFNNYFHNIQEKVNSLQRCIKCLLPSTMPHITFDKKGICNYCYRFEPTVHLGVNTLKDQIDPYRSRNGQPDCIVSFSGGRDSCYALHYAKKVLKLNPIAYSYDWGMLTDLGRRNQARMCGQLGVEHILVSADIQKKREYIKKNVMAWLKKPDLGMIPLFMAGDKQYFYYLNKLRQETGIKLILYSDNPLEKTDFKYGFANVLINAHEKKSYDVGKLNTIKLLYYYLKQFATNPDYLNNSLFDTFTAYLSSYVVPKDYIHLFKYIQWNEEKINDTLIKQYNWETSPDTPSTWRIGDGTASFYNYIYYIIAGFTENDTFRSNQIRQKIINRSTALKLIDQENQPRWESIKWYCDTIGINMKETIKLINSASKRY